MADVFISYHEASAGELAETIAERLDNAGISCWCARRDMPFGGDFAREIPPQIDSCKVFLLLLNENVYASDHIENEVGLAFGRRNKERNIRILPVEIGDFTRKDWIRYYLIHTQSVKFPANPDEQRIQGLVKRVAKLLGNDPPQQPPPPPTSPTPPKPPPKIIKHGECGFYVTYTLYENGLLKISGTGSMWDFPWESKIRRSTAPWWDERETIFYVEIQDGVTAIGKRAFRNCKRLTSVTISDSVTSIRQSAFNGCTELRSVTIPNNVTHIGWWAFYGCTKLTNVTIPNSVTSIGKSAFQDCAGLTNVTIPDSVTVIGDGAFLGCHKLTSVSIPAKAKIDDDAFPAYIDLERRP